MTGPRPMIEVEALHKHFGDNHVLKGIDLSVAVGEVVCIIGPSGSGKSTLLRCINHLEHPDRGNIRIDGKLAYRDEIAGRYRAHKARDIAAVRAQVGMVFQHFNLFPHLTAPPPKPAAAASSCSPRSACPKKPMPTRKNSRADSSSAPPSPARSPWTPRPCCSTKPPARSTPS